MGVLAHRTWYKHALCALMGVPLGLMHPHWGLYTSTVALLGDSLALPAFKVLDVANACHLGVFCIREAHLHCHWTAWFVSIPAFMAWAVGVYALRVGHPEHASIAHDIWHILGLISMFIVYLCKTAQNPFQGS